MSDLLLKSLSYKDGVEIMAVFDDSRTIACMVKVANISYAKGKSIIYEWC